MPADDVAPEILSTFLLIQNMLPTLPDAESMLGFTSRGLENLPGLSSVSYAMADETGVQSAGPGPDPASHAFPVHLGKTVFATIYCTVSNRDAFSRYETYVHNLCFMIAARLEEKRQREAAAKYEEQLEQEVRRRTQELEVARQVAERERIRAERYLDAAETFVVEIDRNGRIERINNRGAELFGMTPGKLTGIDWFDLAVTDEAREDRRREYTAALEKRSNLSSHQDTAVRTSGGETRSIHWHNILRYRTSGELEGILSSGVDVTERARAEKEKEVLLKEVFHRTKNNMHVIYSLLALQSAASSNDEVKTSLVDAQNRIMAMALVHNMLYASEELARLDLHTYLSELGTSLLFGYSDTSARIRFSVTGPKILVSLETAISCGIVLNEIMTNSAKHAFTPATATDPDPEPVPVPVPEPAPETPTITIELEQKGDAIGIRYRDNGSGLPEGWDMENAATLGMQIVYNIVVEQLRGSLVVTGEDGFEARIKFERETR
ncbi:MAG: histidine kinase dimerization/phosphoacceptor domain -containing protein [Alkalispirochaeta sp.]